jgi:endoribonuclease Dicer
MDFIKLFLNRYHIKVALLACELLHKKGELDEHLEPRKKLLIEDEDDDDEDGVVGIGTKKRKAFYSKTLPAFLRSSSSENMKYLYKVDVILDKCPVENVKKIKLCFPEQSESKLGLVLGQEVPNDCSRPFHLYMPSGRVIVTLTKIRETRLNLDEINIFHQTLFRDVLNFVPSWFYEGINTSEFLVVPLRGDDIDESLLNKLANKEEKPSEFHAKSYEDAVVIPKHREDMPRCIVEEILFDMNPDSVMPGSNRVFREYFKSEYGMETTSNQPLLRVRSADKRQDFYNPVQQTKGKRILSSEELRKTRWILFPELVNIHPISGSLWQEC